METLDFMPEPDDDALRRERGKARELRKSQWWKNRRSSGVCYYCRGRFAVGKLTMDHVVPLVRGGKSTKSNLVPACRECNVQKRNLLPGEWQAYLEALAQREVTP